MATRNHNNVLIWDVNMPREPVHKYSLYEPNDIKILNIMDNNCIADRFMISFSPTSNEVVTGLYGNKFAIIDFGEDL